MKSIRAKSLLLVAVLLLPGLAAAEKYLIDTAGAHAAIEFRIKHLGYSWLLGRFDKFAGTFTYDESDPEKSSVDVTIETASVNSNHAERDKHLRDKDFLYVDKFPQAKFSGTSFKPTGDNTGELTGNLTLRGVTKPVTIEVEFIGQGSDPWGGYRRGFAGTTSLTLADFGITRDLGPTSRKVNLFLSVEGIRQ